MQQKGRSSIFDSPLSHINHVKPLNIKSTCHEWRYKPAKRLGLLWHFQTKQSIRTVARLSSRSRVCRSFCLSIYTSHCLFSVFIQPLSLSLYLETVKLTWWDEWSDRPSFLSVADRPLPQSFITASCFFWHFNSRRCRTRERVESKKKQKKKTKERVNATLSGPAEVGRHEASKAWDVSLPNQKWPRSESALLCCFIT